MNVMFEFSKDLLISFEIIKSIRRTLFATNLSKLSIVTLCFGFLLLTHFTFSRVKSWINLWNSMDSTYRTNIQTSIFNYKENFVQYFKSLIPNNDKKRYGPIKKKKSTKTKKKIKNNITKEELQTEIQETMA